MAARKSIIIVLLVVLAAAAAGGGGWWWLNRAGTGAQAGANESADQPLTAELPASADATPAPSGPAAAPSGDRFDLTAMIDDPNGFTNVHSGPSTVAPIVARVSAGESFSTFEQGSDWWRVRTAGGLIGYMPRRRISLQGEAPTPAPASAVAADADAAAPGPQPGAAANAAPTAPRAVRPAPARPRSRINRANSANMRAFCANAGRGTPQCRAFARELRGR